MEEQKPGLMKNALTWGVIMAVMQIIFSVLSYILEFKPTSFINIGLTFLIGLIILIVVLVMAMKAYRINVLGGVMTYGEAFKFGFAVIVISTFISSVYSYIFMAFIDPDYTKRITEEIIVNTEQFMIDRGVPEDQIEKAMEEAANKPIPSAIGQVIRGFFFGIIFSTIINLIIAAIMKKKPEGTFQE